MRQVRNITLLLGCMALLAGCGTFNGNVRFVNSSTRNIVVGKAEGFEYEPPCGILIAGATAGASMGSMKFPQQVNIRWWYEKDRNKPWDPQGDARTNVVDLTHLTPPRDRGTDLRLLFTAEGEWKADIHQW